MSKLRLSDSCECPTIAFDPSVARTTPKSATFIDSAKLRSKAAKHAQRGTNYVRFRVLFRRQRLAIVASVADKNLTSRRIRLAQSAIVGNNAGRSPGAGCEGHHCAPGLCKIDRLAAAYRKPYLRVCE